MHGQTNTRRLRQHNATSLANAQRGLHTLAVERLLERHLVRRQRCQQLAQLLGKREQPLRQLGATTAQPQHSGVHQSHVGRRLSASRHDIAAAQRNRSRCRRQSIQLQLEAAEANHPRARIDSENPHHRHGDSVRSALVHVAILLLAAGRGTRLGADVPKAYLQLRGQPLLVHAALRLLSAVPTGDRCDLIIVAHADDSSMLARHVPPLQRALADRGTVRPIVGGATRQDSMQRGLAATDASVDLVAVHDAARPLVPIEATRECLRVAADQGAALLATPATDTLKRVRSGQVVATVDRSELWYAQTPQIARRELFVRACQSAAEAGSAVTDDVSLLEQLGVPVAVVTGASTNMKVTHPDDVLLATALLEREAAEADSA